MPDLTVSASDGFPLAAFTFGRAESANAAVLLVPAMGVTQGFYGPFAEWLAERGYFVVTFDYRGMGRSRPSAHRQSLRGFQADIATWAERDCAAMVDFCSQAMVGRPLLWIGHSLGGQIFGMVPNRERVSAVATIACGSGYWLETTLRLRLTVWWLWWVVVPLAVRLYGWFPGRRLRKVGDVPAGVMLDWRRACLNPDYLVGIGGDGLRAQYARVRTPIMSLSFTDDEYMSATNISSLHRFYSGAPRDMRRLSPADVRVKHIGHFGFYRPRFSDSLWPMVGDWLAQQVRTLS